MELNENQNISGTIIDEEILPPPIYNVIFFNDDYTASDFVQKVLMNIFNKNKLEAQSLISFIEKNGSSVVGSYPYDIAATKVSITIKDARENGFPLKCKIEES